MKKIIAALNITLDGFCDHTAGIPDQELHDHYTCLIRSSDVILYGRKTFELMEFWRPFVEKPSGEKSMDDFAVAIDSIRKVVFSKTLKNADWSSAELASKSLEETASELREKSKTDILVGSRSLIVQLANLHLIDEFQICVHPVVIGKGLPLFDEIQQRTILKLVETKVFNSGAIILYYHRGE